MNARAEPHQTTGARRVRIGLTLPSFQSDPERVVTVARAAEDAGLDGVFLFDHLFRQRGDAADAERRPALELLAMTAAVAAATDQVMVGTLVARATLRSPAMLRSAFDTLERIAPGRIIAGVGGGDHESLAEDSAFGVLPSDPSPTGATGGEEPAPFDYGAYRLQRLEATVEALAGRAYPVWVAGRSPAAIRIAARADGWNHWGSTPAAFAASAERVRQHVAATGRAAAGAGPDPSRAAPGGGAVGPPPGGKMVGVAPRFTLTWGGLAVLAPTNDEAAAKYERLGGGRPGIIRGSPPEVAEAIADYAAAGADWVIVGPIDSWDPANAAVLGAAARLLARRS